DLRRETNAVSPIPKQRLIGAEGWDAEIQNLQIVSKSLQRRLPSVAVLYVVAVGEGITHGDNPNFALGGRRAINVVCGRANTLAVGFVVIRFSILPHHPSQLVIGDEIGCALHFLEGGLESRAIGAKGKQRLSKESRHAVVRMPLQEPGRGLRQGKGD